MAKDGETRYPFLWECKDGSVVITTRFGPGAEKSNQLLVDWIESDGIEPGVLRRIDWRNDDWGKYTKAEVAEVGEKIESFLKKHTRKELVEGALERRIQLTPLLTPKEQLEFPQLVARDFWQKVEHPELGVELTYPGGFVKLSDTDCRIRRRAPLIGEHNQDIYEGELCLSARELVALKERQVI
jgi:crotonobetainyl-CoA:carnitine CoA-transferase CaiB-like acyl-CoA transferase